MISLSAVAVLGIRGFGYYSSSVEHRAFRADHGAMKASGSYSHGLGILGSAMITIGVITYSTRKRIRKLWKLGMLSRWLEFHIALCLLGPVLVVYHTTFKAGGIAAISLWSMLSVAGSGIVGRYLYSLMPRNIKGTELTAQQMQDELDRLGEVLGANKHGAQLMAAMDGFYNSIAPPESITQTVSVLVRLQQSKGQIRRAIRRIVGTQGLNHTQSMQLGDAARSRSSLLQKMTVFKQVERMFHYWHVIHLPFTVIMFLTLAAHVVVTILLGYRWIF